MNKTIVFISVLMLLIISCAPAPHVRVGTKVNVPVAWQGSYPYAAPDSSVLMGRPSASQLKPAE